MSRNEPNDSESDEGGGADEWLAPYVLFLLAGLIFVICAIESHRHWTMPTPDKDMLVETTGTVEWFSEESDGDVLIKLSGNPTIFISPESGEGWGPLLGGIRKGAAARLLHEPRRSYFPKGPATFEVEIDTLLFVPYDTAARRWRRSHGVDAVLALGIALFALFWMVRSAADILNEAKPRT